MSWQNQAGARHRWTIALALASMAAPGALFAQQKSSDDPATLCAADNLDSTATVGQLKISAFSSESGDCLQVNSGTKVLFRSAMDGGGPLTLGQADSDYKIPEIANGTDVTGRGHPDLIVSLFTGGAHCCTRHYVFELGPDIKLLATLNDADDDMAHFERDPKDHRYNYVTADWTFAYWPTCFACSPSEVVILRWADDQKGGAFHLALDKMQKPAPTTAEWNKNLAAVRKVVSQGDTNSIGQTLWQPVLDLIYSGHSDLAWKFVDAAGPKAQQNPFPTLGEFCRLLKGSSFWLDLAPSVRDLPAACTGSAGAAGK